MKEVENGKEKEDRGSGRETVEKNSHNKETGVERVRGIRKKNGEVDNRKQAKREDRFRKGQGQGKKLCLHSQTLQFP
jgi:hypothetical protein